ncbi:phage holin family protein [Streptococcus sp. S784/96/1]|uniref:phage holin family protein n=1 Tax=Streptococcus sp. S784/96/1 TaxID=2653499 RepID=UPI001EE3DF4D|nr:phage holin family protein [Streptococcus sp. S784/96/1]
MQMEHQLLNLSDVLLAMSSMINNKYIQIFFYLVLLDIATGFVKGFVSKKANSTKGLIGIIKHILVVTLVITVYPYLTLLGANFVAVAFVFYFIGSYGISVVENWTQIGLPIPVWVRKYFEKIQQEADNFDITKKG